MEEQNTPQTGTNVVIIDPNMQDNNGVTALMTASYNGLNNVVATILTTKGIDPNKQNKNGETSLMLASYNGHSKVVELLLAAEGVDVNMQDKNGITALMLAIHKGHTDTVRMLLAAQVRERLSRLSGTLPDSREPLQTINTQENRGFTALMFACYNGHPEMAKMLLAADGIGVNIQDNSGMNALMRASYNGHTEVVELLLAAKGVDVNMQNRNGSTALMFACFSGHVEIARMLLASGRASPDYREPSIDPNKQNKNGETALMLASYNGHSKVVELLLTAEGVDVNLQDKEDNTALMCACFNGHVEIARMLLAFKRRPSLTQTIEESALNRGIRPPSIDPNKQNKYGQTALMRASYNGQSKVVELLLATDGVDVNIQDKNGHTALSICARNGYTAIVELLLASKRGNRPVQASGERVSPDSREPSTLNNPSGGHRSIDVNIPSNEGWTALMRAYYNGHNQIAGLLLDVEGIDVDKKNKTGHTAYDCKIYRHNLEMAKLLEKTNDVQKKRNSSVLTKKCNQNKQQKTLEKSQQLERLNEELKEMKEQVSELKATTKELQKHIQM